MAETAYGKWRSRWLTTSRFSYAIGAVNPRAWHPADELIAATSLTYRVPLVTRNERIRPSRKLKLL